MNKLWFEAVYPRFSPRVAEDSSRWSSGWWPVTGWSSHACTSIFQQKWVHIWQNTHSLTPFGEPRSQPNPCRTYVLSLGPHLPSIPPPHFTCWFFLSAAASSGPNSGHENIYEKFPQICVCPACTCVCVPLPQYGCVYGSLIPAHIL